mgnify:CR=1 FL=1
MDFDHDSGEFSRLHNLFTFHLGIAVMFLGFTGKSWTIDRETTLAPLGLSVWWIAGWLADALKRIDTIGFRYRRSNHDLPAASVKFDGDLVTFHNDHFARLKPFVNDPVLTDRKSVV